MAGQETCNYRGGVSGLLTGYIFSSSFKFLNNAKKSEKMQALLDSLERKEKNESFLYQGDKNQRDKNVPLLIRLSDNVIARSEATKESKKCHCY